MKKGVSPLIAFVLLVAASVAIGILVANFSKESAESLASRVEYMSNNLNCNDIRLSADEICRQGGDLKLTIRNRGTLSIKKAVFRLYGENVDTRPIDINLKPGDNYNYIINSNPSRIEIVPIFLDKEKLIGCEDRIVNLHSGNLLKGTYDKGTYDVCPP